MVINKLVIRGHSRSPYGESTDSDTLHRRTARLRCLLLLLLLPLGLCALSCFRLRL